MSYEKSSRFPLERASKIGHIKHITDPKVRALMDVFERNDGSHEEQVGELSGHIDLDYVGELDKVLAIDGSHTVIPNDLASHRKIAFVNCSALLLKMRDIHEMRRNPITDPREIAKTLESSVISAPWVLPISGVSLPGDTVANSIKSLINQALVTRNLNDTLKFLIYREWDPDYEMTEHMACNNCGEEFSLPRYQKHFKCPHCQSVHYLSDYLRVNYYDFDGCATEAVASDLRSIMETLMLVRFLMTNEGRSGIIESTLFLKDGPLLLHAQLSRLVEPIRAYLKYLTEERGYVLHIVGIEKTGDIVNHLPMIKNVLVQPGDYFIPSVRYIHEHIRGMPFDQRTYVNRVQYGSKVVTRLGKDHVIVADVPTGHFDPNPQVDALYGYKESMAMLSQLLSYQYENALVPLVLVNNLTSISAGPSGRVLEAFAHDLFEE